MGREGLARGDFGDDGGVEAGARHVGEGQQGRHLAARGAAPFAGLIVRSYQDAGGDPGDNSLDRVPRRVPSADPRVVSKA